MNLNSSSIMAIHIYIYIYIFIYRVNHRASPTLFKFFKSNPVAGGCRGLGIREVRSLGCTVMAKKKELK